MLVTGSGLWSLGHAKFVIVPSQDRVRTGSSAPGRSSASTAIDVSLMTLDILEGLWGATPFDSST